MSKKSSIEWLVNELTNLGYIYAPSFGHKIIADKIEQAKIKHKEEQKIAYNAKLNDWYFDFEHYYNSTFGGNND
jgi:hypothetical protein